MPSTSRDPILCLEMAYHRASVALVDRNGKGEVLATALSSKDMNHVSDCNLLIQEVLDKSGFNWSDLTGISFNEGPGSYTGLRVASACAKALCFTHQLSYIPIAAHHILLSCKTHSLTSGYVLINARRGNAFVQRFEKNSLVGEISRKSIAELTVTETDLFLYHASDLSDHLPSEAFSEEIHMDASSQLFSLRHLPTIPRYDFSSIARHRPLYTLSPNITQRKKPLLS